MKYTKEDFPATLTKEQPTRKPVMVYLDIGEHDALRNNAGSLGISMAKLAYRCLKDAGVLGHESKEAVEETFKDDDLDSGGEEAD